MVQVPSDLMLILRELSQPSKNQEEMPQRIELCRRALSLLKREEDATLWAALHGEMASSFKQSLQGSRAGNLEQAIAHYQEVLTVYTREAVPADWALTKSHLAETYIDRICGDRAGNLEQAIALHQEALTVRTLEAVPADWARTQGNLGAAYRDRICGERAANLEQAITLFQEALTVYTRKAFPTDWALTKNHLGAAYLERICGDRAANLEQAITLFQEALTVYTREAFPTDFARIQDGLGNFYHDRICGDRAGNLEQAIALHQDALTVYTREAFPTDWARSQGNLGAAYEDRICGERAANLEQAITLFQEALTVYTREAFPIDWARIQGGLGAAYRKRICGDRAENLEQAIALHQDALTVYTREAFPADWARTKNHLAIAYGHRLCGERAANLEQAIKLFQESLTVYTREAFPADWARIQHNMGTAYGDSDLRWGNGAADLEEAIAHYREALTVYTREAFPADWALTQHNLGTLYYDGRLCGERAVNLEQAIARYREALTVYTREAFPADWARTRHSLAAAYWHRICGDRAANLEEAIAHYREALTVYTREAFPADFQRTQRNLGHLHFGEGAWAAALTAYQEAIRAGQMLLDGAYTDAGRQAEVAKTSKLYAHSAYALLKLARVGEALVQLEQGKTRLLSHALALNELDVNLLAGPHQETLRRLRQTLRELETEMRLPPNTPARRDDRVLAEALNQVRTELHDAIAHIRAAHPDFMPEGLSLSEILSLVPSGAALVAPIVTSQGTAVFVVPTGLQSVSLEQVLWIDEFTETDLHSLLRGSTEEAQLGGWLGAYFNAHTNTKAWFDAIESSGQALWTQLMGPIDERLATLQVNQVLLLPQGGLGLLPLHAAWHEVDGKRHYFFDDYTVPYLPSAYAYAISLERMSDTQRSGRSLLAVINPTKDLPFTPIEGEQVARLFEKGNATVLPGVQATAEAVLSKAMAAYVHFSCHGFYMWDDPMQSGLVLANHEPLTLAQIIGHFNLESTRLVTLSACETGITDIRQSPDEYLGLPTGCLQAGAPAVVSTLWAVNDLSTMLLMERFYQLHLKEGMELPEALRHAQIWLRDVTAGKLTQRFAGEEEALLSSTRMSIKTASDYFARFTKLDPKQKPFAHPYYWAAFTFSGA